MKNCSKNLSITPKYCPIPVTVKWTDLGEVIIYSSYIDGAFQRKEIIHVG